MLQVTRAAFYKWLHRPPSATKQKQSSIVNEIKRIHSLLRHQDYSSLRIHRELTKQGIECSENTVAKLMKENQIRARPQPQFKVTTTDSKHNFPIAPNLLKQQFTVSNLNQVWLTDLTYIPTWEGFSYFCAFKDLCSRRIVGGAMSRKINAQLVIAAFDLAVALRQPPQNLIVHSDRGSQYASHAFRKRMNDCHFRQSMSRKGNCYDNAPMESFFKSFKVEEVYHEKYATHEHAVRAATDYIERFYNPKRLHSALGYMSPNEFEHRKFYEKKCG